MFPQVIDKFDFSKFKTMIIKTSLPESVYAKNLFLATEKFPSVLIGSYPKVFNPDCKTEIVLKSKDEAALQKAFDYINGFVTELQENFLK